MSDFRLALSVTRADGTITRWGPDEPNAEDVPEDLSCSDSIPGGFKDLTCSLLRRIDRRYPDEALYDDVRVYGPGNQTVWEGRVAQLPRQHSDAFSVRPGAIGWAAHLRDDPSFREVYVDRDFGRWQDASRARQVGLLASSFQPRGFTVVPDATNGLPALILQIDGAWTAPTLPISLADYDAGSGVTIASVYYDLTTTQSGGNWNLLIQVRDTDDQSGSHNYSSSNLSAASASGTFTPTLPQRFVEAWHFFNATGGAANGTYQAVFRHLALYGNHGLTKRGTAPQGFYASDVIADIITRAAPMLRYTTGDMGTITPTTFVIPHLAFLSPVTAEDAIMEVNKYHLYDWAVWEDRTFYWGPATQDVVWHARQSDGAHLDLDGDDANNVFNGVFATYTDPSGRERTVGPPSSNADTEDDSLEDTSVDNPVNAHGITRRWGRLDISTVQTPASATQIAALWLAEHNMPARRGTMTLSGDAHHPTMGRQPVWKMRAGEYVTLADRPGDVPRKIIEKRYDHGGTPRVTLSLDNTVFKLDAILERMGVSLIGVL